MKNVNYTDKCILYALKEVPGMIPSKLAGILRLVQLDQKKNNAKELQAEFHRDGANWASMDVKAAISKLSEYELIQRQWMTGAFSIVTKFPIDPEPSTCTVINHLIKRGYHKVPWHIFRKMEKEFEDRIEAQVTKS
jgi:hypothetical protein